MSATTITARGRRLQRTAARREALLPWGFLAPSLVVLGAITVYPLLYAIVLSLREGSLIAVDGWAGLGNYGELLGDEQFKQALRFSAIFTLATTAGSFVVGLGFALAVNQVRRGAWLLRMLLLLPFVVPPVVSVVAWRWMTFSDDALANQMLGWVGAGPVSFLSEPTSAAVMVVMLRIWRTFPFMFITLLAARQTISSELYEAAALDGAGPFSRFLHVTMPQLARVAIVNSLLVAIWSFNDFESIYLLTQGGPSGATYNVIVLSYYKAFFGNDVGTAAAMGVVGLVLLSVLAVVLVRMLRRMERA
jgi:ABC-type sugar transport system permease subunit